MNTKLQKVITIITVICVLFGFSGCSGAGNDLYPDSAYKIFKIEECEYILISRRPFAAEFSLTHKGNCTNQIHIYAKQ